MGKLNLGARLIASEDKVVEFELKLSNTIYLPR